MSVEAEPSSGVLKRATIWAAQVLLLATLYMLAARLGLALSHAHANVTLVWPPTGLALAALILFGLRLWPGVFIGVLLINLTDRGMPLPPVFAIAGGNTQRPRTADHPRP